MKVWKISESLWQRYSDKPVTNGTVVILDITYNGDGKSDNFKEKITCQTMVEQILK